MTHIRRMFRTLCQVEPHFSFWGLQRSRDMLSHSVRLVSGKIMTGACGLLAYQRPMQAVFYSFLRILLVSIQLFLFDRPKKKKQTKIHDLFLLSSVSTRSNLLKSFLWDEIGGIQTGMMSLHWPVVSIRCWHQP